MRIFLYFLALLLPMAGTAQVLQRTYYPEGGQVKEEYYVQSERNKILDGTYKSYYRDGTLKNEGQFQQNKSVGLWKYYFENGKLRMRGEIQNGKAVGSWDYFYENGQPKMQGQMQAGIKVGFWTYYYRNGAKESEGNYENGHKSDTWKYFHDQGVLKATEDFSGMGSFYEEVYETGSIKSEGKRLNGRQVEEWLFYHEDGTLQARGNYVDGKRNGLWKYFDEGGRLEAEGRFEDDLASGLWLYYHENGSVASQGELVKGERNGGWKMFYQDGALKGEANYLRGDGDYREFYKSGALKVKGQFKDGFNHGPWEYFYENGNLEGTCNFVMGEGEYRGYYNNGVLKMKGMIKNDLRVGIWELYEQSGEITGYYKPYYEEGEAAFFIADDAKEQKELSEIRRARVGTSKKYRKQSRYFKKRIHEYKALIFGYNPIAPLINVVPVSFEYYLEERMGYEVMLQYWRDPFFRSFESLDDETVFSQGGAITGRQKFYHKESPIGQPYFAHELKYTFLYHNTNLAGQAVQGAFEQKMEYGVLVGTRYFKNVNASGFTVDSYIGFAIGYRDFNKTYEAPNPAGDPFRELNSNNFAYSIRIGVNLGYAFRIKR